MSTRDVGAAAEELAARHLESLGWRLLARNWRGKGGELDIVAEDGTVVVVVEVKARASDDYGRPEEAVDARKQGRVARAAQEFILARGLSKRPVRFDVAAVEDGKVRLLKAAFDAPGWAP